MRKSYYILTLICMLGLYSCDVSFKTLTLEDPKAQYFKPIVGLGDFKSTDVFSNSAQDVWGIEKDDCKDIQLVSDPVYSGGSAISLEWNRYACDWAGMGIGWDGYAGKDLSSIMDLGAFQFKLRSIKGETTIPTIIFLLEDYSGTFCAAVFGSAALESYPINETWQTATIPLSLFPAEEDGLDVSNIKQLVMELQGLGAIMIDEMKIVEYHPKNIAGKKVLPPSNVKLQTPAIVFEDAFKNVWGLAKMECRNYSLSTEKPNSGSTCVHMKWQDQKDCQWMEWGTSWTEWKGVDMDNALQDGILEFYVRTSEIIRADLPLQVGFQSYNGATTYVSLKSDYSAQKQYGMEWTKVHVPLSAFTWEKDNANPKNVKQLVFKGKEQGDLFIDDIRIFQEAN
jgi:hypothetical protein